MTTMGGGQVHDEAVGGGHDGQLRASLYPLKVVSSIGRKSKHSSLRPKFINKNRVIYNKM